MGVPQNKKEQVSPDSPNVENDSPNDSPVFFSVHGPRFFGWTAAINDGQGSQLRQQVEAVGGRRPQVQLLCGDEHTYRNIDLYLQLVIV